MSIIKTIFDLNQQISKRNLSVDELSERTLQQQTEIANYFQKANYEPIEGRTLFFFCLILANSLEYQTVDITAIAASLRIKRIDLIHLKYEIIVSELVAKDYIERINMHRHNESREVIIEPRAYNSILQDLDLEPKTNWVEDLNGIALKSKNLLEDVESRKIDLKTAVIKIKEIAKRVESPFIRFLNKYTLSDVDYLIIMMCLYDYLNEPFDHQVSVNSILDTILDSVKFHKVVD